MGLLMGKFHQFLTELSACHMIVGGIIVPYFYVDMVHMTSFAKTSSFKEKQQILCPYAFVLGKFLKLY